MKLFLTALLLVSGTAYSKLYRPHSNVSGELKSFGSCEILGEHLKKNFSETNYNMAYDTAEISMPMLAKSSDAAPAAPQSVTGTNNQVANVDEADFVKFDGKYLYQIHDNQLKIIKAWPANTMSLVGSISIPNNPRELLVEDNKAVTVSDNGDTMTVSVVDLQNKNTPAFEVQFEIPGNYITARKIGSTLRLISRDYNVRLNNQSPSTNVKTSAKELLNLRASVRILGNVRNDMDSLENCKHVYAPEKVSAPLTRIVTIDLKNRKFSETLAFIDAQTVYASESAIYLAQQGWNESETTAIHKFTTKNEATAEYAATGAVAGYLINQFAMDEYKDHLRVATTGNELIRTAIWGGQSSWEQTSVVQVLKQNSKQLEVVGKTPRLAKGERIYSVRFDGDKGYMVTFRQVDPLFTLDLSNPRNPRAVGELKIPGFSTYIHKLGDKHLLTIGQDADANTGRARGIKLSVFDVSQFNKPKEIKSIVMNSNVNSDATYEHKAFTFYAEKGILAIPVSAHVPNAFRSSLLLFKVTPNDIVNSGEIPTSELSTVQRSFFADDIVYAIGANGIRASNFATPQKPHTTLLYENKIANTNGW